MKTSRREFLEGIWATVPLLLGIVPVGILFGVLATGVGLHPLATQALSMFIYAGGAQFVAINLIVTNTPILVVVLAILVVNLRYMVYSASLVPFYQKLTPRWRFFLAWLLTDESCILASIRYRQRGNQNAHWHVLGSTLSLWGAWQISTAIGITFAPDLSGRSLLDIALPLTLLVLLTPLITNRAIATATVAAGIMSALLGNLPYNTGILFAMIAGVAVGLLFEHKSSTEIAVEKGEVNDSNLDR